MWCGLDVLCLTQEHSISPVNKFCSRPVTAACYHGILCSFPVWAVSSSQCGNQTLGFWNACLHLITVCNFSLTHSFHIFCLFIFLFSLTSCSCLAPVVSHPVPFSSWFNFISSNSASSFITHFSLERFLQSQSCLCFLSLPVIISNPSMSQLFPRSISFWIVDSWFRVWGFVKYWWCYLITSFNDLLTSAVSVVLFWLDWHCSTNVLCGVSHRLGSLAGSIIVQHRSPQSPALNKGWTGDNQQLLLFSLCTTSLLLLSPLKNKKGVS